MYVRLHIDGYKPAVATTLLASKYNITGTVVSCKKTSAVKD